MSKECDEIRERKRELSRVEATNNMEVTKRHVRK